VIFSRPLASSPPSSKKRSAERFATASPTPVANAARTGCHRPQAWSAWGARSQTPRELTKFSSRMSSTRFALGVTHAPARDWPHPPHGAYHRLGKVLAAVVDTVMIAQNPCRPLPGIERQEMRFLTPLRSPVWRTASGPTTGHSCLLAPTAVFGYARSLGFAEVASTWNAGSTPAHRPAGGPPPHRPAR
jgi:hypothetical protein